MKTQPFGRKPAADENHKPVQMVFDGKNGDKITEWSRDDNLAARFMHRPDIEGEPARVLVTEPNLQWLPVPVGSTIRLQRDGSLELVEPRPEAEANPSEEDTSSEQPAA